MVQKVARFDDLDGSEGAQLVLFSYGYETEAGEREINSFQLDLGKANYDALTEALAPFVAVAAPAKVRGARSARGQGVASGVKARRDYLERVRTWARENKYTVSDRGSLPRMVLAAYMRANPTDEGNTGNNIPFEAPETEEVAEVVVVVTGDEGGDEASELADAMFVEPAPHHK